MFRRAMTIDVWLKFGNPTEREQLLPMVNEVEFENFYNVHSRPLWAYVRRVSNSAEIADDIVQESFMRFLGATLRSGDNGKAYLYRIATNLTYDYFRRNSREMKRQMSLQPTDEREESAYEPFAAESEIAHVFDKLKMQERSLLWLAYVEGHQHDEIAKMLGLKSLSVRVLLFRARRKLAALLDANNFEVNKL